MELKPGSRAWPRRSRRTSCESPAARNHHPGCRTSIYSLSGLGPDANPLAPSASAASIPIHLPIPEPTANSRYPTGVRVILAFLLSLAAAFAQTPQERGKRLVDETLAAIGGDRFLAVQDRTE